MCESVLRGGGRLAAPHLRAPRVIFCVPDTPAATPIPMPSPQKGHRFCLWLMTACNDVECCRSNSLGSDLGSLPRDRRPQRSIIAGSSSRSTGSWQGQGATASGSGAASIDTTSTKDLKGAWSWTEDCGFSVPLLSLCTKEGGRGGSRQMWQEVQKDASEHVTASAAPDFLF